MRLQLIAALLALPAPAPAQESTATSKLSLYADDDDTLIGTALVQADLVLPARAVVGAHVLVDSISSASVDVVSAATPGFEETRIELGARARLVRKTSEVGLGYVRSTENDWWSHSFQLELTRELAQKNARVRLGYGYTTNEVGRSGDDAFSKDLVTHTVELAVTQLLDPRTLVGAAYTLQVSDGWQSSPYRYVTVTGTGAAFLETHPTERLRHAITLRALRYVADAGLEVTYRLYGDDWGVLSHTATASATWAVGEHVDLRVRGRAYYQGAADFHRERYDMAMTFMTADRELSTFSNLGGGVKLAWHPGPFTLDAKLDAFVYRFFDFARLEGRAAIVGDIGVGVVW